MAKCITCLKEIPKKEFLKHDHRCKKCDKSPNWREKKRCKTCKHAPHNEVCAEPIAWKPTLKCGCEGNQ